MDDSGDLHIIRDALATGIDDLETAVDWLKKTAPQDPHAPGAASVNLLMLAGTVIGGYQMARAAVAVGKGTTDPAFAKAKLQTAVFYATHILPRASAYRAAATAGSTAVMALDEDRF